MWNKWRNKLCVRFEWAINWQNSYEIVTKVRSCRYIEYIVWYGQFVTNWCDFIEMPFHSTKFSSWRMAKSLVIWRYGYFDSKQKWRCRLRYRRRWCHIITFIERNTIAIVSQSFVVGIYAICLTYGRDCHWSSNPQWVKIWGHSEQLRPCGSQWINFTHCQRLTLTSQNLGRFWPNWWSWKSQAGNAQKSGCILY